MLRKCFRTTSPPPANNTTFIMPQSREGHRLGPCSCALIPTTWPGAQMCTQATATIWAMWVPCGTKHLQMLPYYLIWWCTYRPIKCTSGKNSFNLSNQTCLDWGTIQKSYCSLSVSSAHQTKATQHLARTQCVSMYIQTSPENALFRLIICFMLCTKALKKIRNCIHLK